MAVTISPTKFYHAFNSFLAMVKKEQSGDPFRDFQQGYAYKEEFYKTRVHGDALRILDAEKWKSSMIGSGKIIQAVVLAIQIHENNLMEWRGKRHPAGRSHMALLKAAQANDKKDVEAALFAHFRDKVAPEKSMVQLTGLFARKYDFIAYLFYLRDWERFMPIAPTHFDRVFPMLDVRVNGQLLKMRKRCSWENYSAYNEAFGLVREALEGMEVPRVRLLDAHSFCWMLRNCEIAESDSPAEIEPLEPTVIDFEARARRLKLIGDMAEEAVLNLERRRLAEAGRADLSEKVRRVSADHTLGYDIESRDVDGSIKHIEVKAIRRDPALACFYFTENERQKSRSLPNYWLYLVTGAGKDRPDIQWFPAEALKDEFLSPVVHVARMPLPR